MKAFGQFRPPEIVVAMAVAISCTIGVVMGLHGMAKPIGFDQRMAGVEQDLDQVSQILGRRGATTAFPADAICVATTSSSEAEKLRLRIMQAATLSGLDQTTVTVSPQDAGSARLIPLRVRIDASGSYPAAINTINRLSLVRPTLFLDTVDLNSKTSIVNLTISGRVFCSAPH